MSQPATTRYRELAVALLLDAVGAGAALLIAGRGWQHLRAAREGPFPDVRITMSGRDVDGAVTALALVALAGVVALLATRGRARRVVGGVIALAGVGVVWRAVVSSGAVDNARALDFITAHRRTASSLPGTRVRIDVIAVWPLLTMGCGVLVALAGLFVLVRGGRWQGMSARYETQPAGDVRVSPADDPDDPDYSDDPDAAAAARARAAAALWASLDRGEDPTGDDPTVGERADTGRRADPPGR